jgi:hypothetical protein
LAAVIADSWEELGQLLFVGLSLFVDSIVALFQAVLYLTGFGDPIPI